MFLQRAGDETDVRRLPVANYQKGRPTQDNDSDSDSQQPKHFLRRWSRGSEVRKGRTIGASPMVGTADGLETTGVAGLLVGSKAGGGLGSGVTGVKIAGAGAVTGGAANAGVAMAAGASPGGVVDGGGVWVTAGGAGETIGVGVGRLVNIVTGACAGKETAGVDSSGLGPFLPLRVEMIRRSVAEVPERW